MCILHFSVHVLRFLIFVHWIAVRYSIPSDYYSGGSQTWSYCPLSCKTPHKLHSTASVRVSRKPEDAPRCLQLCGEERSTTGENGGGWGGVVWGDCEECDGMNWGELFQW